MDDRLGVAEAVGDVAANLAAAAGKELPGELPTNPLLRQCFDALGDPRPEVQDCAAASLGQVRRFVASCRLNLAQQLKLHHSPGPGVAELQSFDNYYLDHSVALRTCACTLLQTHDRQCVRHADAAICGVHAEQQHQGAAQTPQQHQLPGQGRTHQGLCKPQRCVHRTGECSKTLSWCTSSMQPVNVFRQL